jgi:hypothetical protein
VTTVQRPHEYGSREARDHWKEILDIAESGSVAVVRRNAPVAVVSRQVLDDALAVGSPFNVQVSFFEGQVSMWIDGLPTHGAGDTLDEAEDDFLNALEDYADDWIDDLHRAPNHQAHGGRVRRILLCAGDRDLLRRVVFDEAEPV